MKFFKTIQLVVACLFLFQVITAQPPALPGFTIQTYGAANGLPSSEILSLYQDEKDFIWIGTRSGVSRYDGRQFQNFEYINAELMGAVYGIAEDRDGTLWVSSETGLYYWQDKGFVRFLFKDENSFLPFYSIYFTAANQAWLGTAGGPVNFNAASKNSRSSLLKNLLPQWHAFTNDDAADYISSSAKGMVFGSKHHVYDYQNKQLKKVNAYHGGTDVVSKLWNDDEGTIYWTTVLNGFNYCKNGQTISPAIIDAFFFDGMIAKGTMYAYSNAAIYTVDPTNKLLRPIVNINPLQLSSPTRLLVGKEGSFWAGTTEGLYHIRKNNFVIHRDTRSSYTDVFSLLRRRNGDLLIGANRGLLFSVTDSLRPYKPLPKVVPLAEVFTMYEEEDASLWFGTGYQGIAYYKNGVLKNFNTKNGLPDNTHHAFLKKRNGEFWSCGDGGVTKIIRAGADSIRFQFFPYNTNTNFIQLSAFIEGNDGVVWAVGPLGIFYLNKDRLTPYTLPGFEARKLSATAIIKDKNDKVWIATLGHGILQCVFKNSHLVLQKQWSMQDGLPANNFLSIAIDQQGNIWAGSYSSISVLVQEKQSAAIKNFDMRDGFINKNYQTLYLYADGGDMWACTSAGPISFQPAVLLKQSRSAPLYITAFDLLNTRKVAEEYLDSSERGEPFYNFPNSINSFSIQFAALYYNNPEAVRYYYRLQGVDNSWTSTGNERTIIFRQLPPGSYKLLLKASLGGTDWTNTVTILFTINKPWWLQWWAIGAAITTIAFFIFYYIKQREKKLKLKEQVNTEIEKLKSASYQHQLEIEQVINYFATSLHEHTTIDGVLWDVARNCISRLGFEDCVIYLKNEEGNKLIQKAAWGPKTTEENKIINPIEIPLGKGIVGNVAITGKPQKIGDTSRDKRYIIDDEARASEITVPIYEGDTVTGVIDSEHHLKDFYTDRHLHILTTIASHCGAKISTLKAEARTASAKMESLLNKQKALEASLQSMRLQMNPHFLFNALNSIQQMILSGDETTATRFLSKFSKLLRTVLTNSDKEKISLKEEIELLQLYMDLESLRFIEAFDYSIECDEEIDAEAIYVPSLLLQPLVENAIWHGLMHKTESRILSVRFESCKENCLLCIIEDNGVGRQAATSNGNTQAHTGKGLSVAIERLQTLNEKNNTKNRLQITDKKEENGLSAGTRIDITLYHN